MQLKKTDDAMRVRYAEAVAAYVAFELSTKHVKEARSIFRQYHRRKMHESGNVAICEAWLRFEREHGSAEDYFQAFVKAEPVLSEAASAVTEAAQPQLAADTKVGLWPCKVQARLRMSLAIVVIGWGASWAVVEGQILLAVSRLPQIRGGSCPKQTPSSCGRRRTQTLGSRINPKGRARSGEKALGSRKRRRRNVPRPLSSQSSPGKHTLPPNLVYCCRARALP